MVDRYSRLLANKKMNNEQPKTGKDIAREKENAIDPRSDLKSDHLFWVDLLINAKHLYPEAFPVLHGIRCSGTMLAQTDTGGLKLLPGNNTPEEWDDIKQRWLAPVREKLIHLLQVTSMGRLKDGEIPADAKPVKTKQTSLRDAWLKG